jgi:hypothetical protein
LPGASSDHDSPTSASCLAEIIGKHHHAWSLSHTVLSNKDELIKNETCRSAQRLVTERLGWGAAAVSGIGVTHCPSPGSQPSAQSTRGPSHASSFQ